MQLRSKEGKSCNYRGETEKKTRKEYLGRDIKLTKAEVNVVKNGRMLTDRHITVANQMLRKQFPDMRGLKSPVMGQSLCFPVTELPFVQEIHAGENHWLTVVAVDYTTVKMFDSMFRCHVCLSKQLQCCSLMRTIYRFILKMHKSRKAE